MPFPARLRVRGSCGPCAAEGVDISRSGLSFLVDPVDLRLASGANLAEASACVQTRLGSRFPVDLHLTAAGRGRVRKVVTLVRLTVGMHDAGGIVLGGAFVDALDARETAALGLAWPAATAAAADEVRRPEDWTDGGRAPLDPRLGEEKVESLLGVRLPDPVLRDERRPRHGLEALLRPAASHMAPPRVLRVVALTEATVRVELHERDVRALGAEPGDFTTLAQRWEAAYGAWPALELLADRRRVWHGSVHACGLEVAGPGQPGAILRLALGRRLAPSDLARLAA